MTRPEDALAAPEEPADLLLTNARIYTSDARRPNASAVAIRGKTIVFVGESRDRAVASLVGARTRVVDVRGRAIVPGIVDAHTHPSLVLTRWHLALPAGGDVRGQLRHLQAYAEEHPPAEVPFIYAEYYDSDGVWGPGGPSAAIIDEYVSDRPVLMQDSSDHAATINTRMLELLEVDASTPIAPNPNDHAMQFERGADGVTPTGHVLEGAWTLFADRMWQKIGWAPPTRATPELLSTFIDALSSQGVSALFDAITDEHLLGSAAELERRGRLNMHYHGAVQFSSLDDLSDAISEVRRLEARFGSPLIRVNALKLFLDGTNEIGTSSVLEPFALEGHEHDHGVLRMGRDDLVEAMRILNGERIDLHLHVVGDNGFRVALDAVEQARATAGAAWALQVTLAHAELVDPEDMKRVAGLGVFINWTCHWSGGYFGLGAAAWLGWDRFVRMYQFNAIIRSGGVVSYGSDVVSDYEAHRADPYFGMQIAHTRLDPEETLGPSRGTVPGTSMREAPDARISREDLLDGYTRNGALQLRLGDRLGSIEEGKHANLAILNQDPMTVDPDRIRDTAPDAVLFEGALIRGEFPDLPDVSDPHRSAGGRKRTRGTAGAEGDE
ncbi:amidohydrolase [Leucobacter sp. wl10]|uniref:amidohydrolase n=1 Tax=Leucobacter sp. wl10 TaxID=2304677 RepID=UPI000E964865|nr:amidohydrolase family protein [Leucobacter sp. wl10]RGE17637.1 hypothetical protein D1J51_15605 [Leucobacter sp. wl10]